jgi:5'-deoxynucleotidase
MIVYAILEELIQAGTHSLLKGGLSMECSFFPAFLYRMRNIYRWSLMRNTQQDTVAVHSYYVSLWTHLLCSIANEIYNKQIPTDKVVSMALFHDAPEIFVGDVAQPVKHSNPEILRHFREIEQSAAERLLSMLPPKLEGVYRPLIVDHPPELYKYVKGADLIDAYIKCVSELTAGNREFSVAKEQILTLLHKLDMPEIEYFLEYMAPAFEKTVDEMTFERSEF